MNLKGGSIQNKKEIHYIFEIRICFKAVNQNVIKSAKAR